MNEDELLKDHLQDYLESKGINTAKQFKCLNPGHPDKHPSMSYDKGRNKIHCFACGVDWDLIDLIGAENGVDTAEAFKMARSMYLKGVRTPVDAGKKADVPQYDQARKNAIQSPPQTAFFSFTKEIDQAHAEARKTGRIQHFLSRGISETIIDKYKLGYMTSYNDLIQDHPELHSKLHKQHLYNYVFPFIEDNGNVSYFMAELSDRSQEDRYTPKYLKPSNPDGSFPGRLWNERYITGEQHEYVFITEGPYDALTYETIGHPAIATTGTSYQRLLDLCREHNPSTHFIISMDNDKPGHDVADKIAEGLKALHLQYTKADTKALYGGSKDPNEAMQKDGDAFNDRTWTLAWDSLEAGKLEEKQQLEEYARNNAKNYIQDFVNGIANSVNTPAISTGFTQLDRELDGGLYEGLYVLGAISSLGKTTLALQIADQVAQTGQDVLIFSLEMARTELMAKSISRLTADLCRGEYRNAKTTRGITAGKRYAEYSQAEKDLISQSITAYSQYADKIYISEGLGTIGTKEIEETIERHIHITGKRPLVLVDYLQILTPTDPRMTDKQATDRNVFDLKRISRNFKTPVLVIASFNRDSYTKKVSMSAFKESGAIEYSSDVLLALQFQDMNDIEEGGVTTHDAIDRNKREDIRKIELKILKNRNGQTGGQVNFDYIPKFNHFKESEIPAGIYEVRPRRK